MIEVLQAGPLTLVQDLGRQGQRALGLPQGGVMDPLALQQANALLGNAPDAAAIECVAGPLRLRVLRDAWVVQAGAPFELRIDGRLQQSLWRRPVLAGQQVELRGPLRGQYGLLAFDGGVATAPVLGARATLLRAALGGHEGRALRAGDLLPLGIARAFKRPRGLLPDLPTLELALLLGPEWPQLDERSRELLWASEWTLSPEADRMGLRLRGPALNRQGPELASYAVLPGLLQLPPDGQPILLGPDAQTTGGYPRIGQLAGAELWKLAHLRPGQALRFLPTDLDTARQQGAQQRAELRQLRSLLDALDRSER